MRLVAPRDETIAQRLADELAAVEELFVGELASDLICVNELTRHVERYRGKRLRPMLVLVSGMATSADGMTLTPNHRVLATVVEMIHMATLVHDDVLDEAEVRRGGSTVNYLRGNEPAVMLGDYMISHAYHLCSSVGSQHIARLVASTTNTVCEGELLQLANRENWQLDEPTYFDIIRRKTASLCGVCCRLAAMLHDAPDSHANALESYGEKLGIAFQIVDDVLDLTGDEQTVGKSVGRDLLKGKLTLPLIHYMQSSEVAQKQAMLELINQVIEDGSEESAAAQEVRRIMVDTGSVEHARHVAQTLVQEAKDALAVLSPSTARELLEEAADAVLTRKY